MAELRGKVVVTNHCKGYEVTVWLKGIKSPNERFFKTKQEAMEEVNRIMVGMSLPSSSLEVYV